MFRFYVRKLLLITPVGSLSKFKDVATLVNIEAQSLLLKLIKVLLSAGKRLLPSPVKMRSLLLSELAAATQKFEAILGVEKPSTLVARAI